LRRGLPTGEENGKKGQIIAHQVLFPMSVATAEFLTIVSGLPRSGTSMMMRMLEMGGLPVLTDHVRTPDDDNPNGYYEFEAVKQTKEDGAWLEGSEGKAVKMVYRLLYDLPADRSYRVLFMRRKLEEVLASQKVMLERHGMADGVSEDQMSALFRAEIDAFYKWVAGQSHIGLIDVDYNRMQKNPRAEAARVNEFLGGSLNEEAMVAVVDQSLYRNRK
jgi:Sulfotransferase domain